MPEARLELARPKSGDFESPASTNSATRALTAGYSLSLALSILLESQPRVRGTVLRTLGILFSPRIREGLKLSDRSVMVRNSGR